MMKKIINSLKHYSANLSFSLLAIDSNKSVEEYLKSDSSPGVSGAPDYFSFIIRAFFALLFVTLFMIITLYIFKRYMNKSNLAIFDKKKSIEVLSSIFIGPKKSICIVRVEDEVLVLGVTAQSINFLTKLKSHEEKESVNTARTLQNISEKIISENSIPSNVEKLSSTKVKIHKDNFDDIFDNTVDDVFKQNAFDEYEKEITSSIDDDSFQADIDGEKALLENLKKLRNSSPKTE